VAESFVRTDVRPLARVCAYQRADGRRTDGAVSAAGLLGLLARSAGLLLSGLPTLPPQPFELLCRNRRDGRLIVGGGYGESRFGDDAVPMFISVDRPGAARISCFENLCK